MSTELTLQDPTIRCLASAALLPDLRSILLIDATPEQLKHTAALLKQLLEAVEGEGVEVATMAPTETDDTLWGMPFLPTQSGDTHFIWRGLLAANRSRQAVQLVIIPNLAELTLAAERALVMAVGADVVHLERHGQQDRWQPQICWLAACAEEDIGKASSHILDRFALRLNRFSQRTLSAGDAVTWLFQQMSVANRVGSKDAPLIANDLITDLQTSVSGQASFSAEAAARVTAYPTRTSPLSMRRHLTLSRLALAQALLACETTVVTEHVDLAAEIIGLEPLKLPVDDEESRSSKDELPAEEEKNPQPPTEHSLPPPRQTPAQPSIEPTSEPAPLHKPDSEASLPSAQLPEQSKTPYPEDNAVPERESASLRLPMRQSYSRTGPRGPAIGVEPARDLHDLAMAATLFSAAKFWGIRRMRGVRQNKWLTIHSSDLRQHRRLPVPESLLVMVIDYTSLRKCAWDDALLPHLEWAYTSRAGIALIQVGAKDAPNELRAERFLGRSLLAPQIERALEAKPGRATPLAHGLDLALRTLRHAMQHGRTAVSGARLVVLTDGRGNIPLNASRTGKILPPVNREGIDDALNVATQIGRLPGLNIVFLDPQPAQHPELPLALANGLGADPVAIPKRPPSYLQDTYVTQEVEL